MPDRTLAQQALYRATQSLGVREDQGRNWGKWVRFYLQAAGLFFPAPWCAAFVSFKVGQAARDLGLEWQWPRRGGAAVSSSALYRWARKRGHLLPAPQDNCVFLIRGGPTGYRHTGFVSRVLPGGQRFTTIEGNVRDRVSARQLRTAGKVFIRIA